VIRDQSGAAYVETLVAFFPTLFFFLAIFQYSEVAAANLIVRRAAHAAVRAAVVVYPDDPRFYGGASATARSPYVQEAARRTLLAAPEIDLALARVAVSGTLSGNSEVTVDLSVPYRCSVFWARLVCGFDGVIDLNGRATLPYLGTRPPAGG
jgi:Flp pilus assembly protein TadG